jgi:hypothetical protein
MIGPKSARSTAPYQIEASASTSTSPTRVAVGAIHAAALTAGSRPSKANIGIRQSCTPAACQTALHTCPRHAPGGSRRGASG